MEITHKLRNQVSDRKSLKGDIKWVTPSLYFDIVFYPIRLIQTIIIQTPFMTIYNQKPKIEHTVIRKG